MNRVAEVNRELARRGGTPKRPETPIDQVG